MFYDSRVVLTRKVPRLCLYAIPVVESLLDLTLVLEAGTTLLTAPQYYEAFLLEPNSRQLTNMPD